MEHEEQHFKSRSKATVLKSTFSETPCFWLWPLEILEAEQGLKEMIFWAKQHAAFLKSVLRINKTGEDDTGIKDQFLTTKETDLSNIWVPQVGDKSIVFLCD